MQTLPLHFDLFTFIILLGVAQAVFLGIFFLAGPRKRYVANQCLGWLMLSLSAVIGEIFLCYSNYMFRMLELVDFSEPLNFVMAPLFYLFVIARIRGSLPTGWRWHFVPAILWAIYAITWLSLPLESKYNNYLNAYHPNLPDVAEPAFWLPNRVFWLRDYINELTLISCLVYNVASLVAIRRAYRQLGHSIWHNQPARLAQLRNLTLLFLVLPVLVAIIKPNFQRDLGDYLLASYLTMVIYATSIRVMAGSRFTEPEPQPPLPEPDDEPRKKYEKSALSDEVEEAILQKLVRLMTHEKPYLQSDLSLPKLAGLLGTSPHYVSQLLNDRLNLSFFDLLATYRVREAQQLLNDTSLAHLKIDEIAERVGYNSTSAFHTAFKRLTSQTPAQYRNQPGELIQSELLWSSSRSA